MEYRRLGKSGLKVSALSYGSWVTFSFQVDESAAIELMKAAYDAGINFFDNAEIYADGKSEILMGRALRKLGWGRDTYCVSSKVFWGGELPTQRGLSRKHVHDACHAALERLQVDYLDLFFCHRPDVETPIEETVRAMDTLVQQGKVLYWGTSEWDARQITEAHGVARECGLTPPTMEQPEYNMLRRDKVEQDFLPLYDGPGLGLTTWSPLASGVLTGKYNRGIPDGSRMTLPDYQWLKEMVIDSPEGQANLDRARALEGVAREIGISMTEMAIAWCLKNPRVSTVILGARNLEQLQDNLRALDAVSSLDEAALVMIEAALQNKPEPPRTF